MSVNKGIIRFLKLLFAMLYAFVTWIVVPAIRLFWKGTPQQFFLALLGDEQIQRYIVDSGQAHLLMQLQQTFANMTRPGEERKPPTEEDIQWARFIQDYGADPHPERVPEYLAYVKRGGTTGSTELPTAGAILALSEKHPDLSHQWGQEFPELMADVTKWTASADPNRAGWNDYHMVRWFILRTDEEAGIIARRAELPGVIGETCNWMINSVSRQVDAFGEAMERVGYFEHDTAEIKPLCCPACGVQICPPTPKEPSCQ